MGIHPEFFKRGETSFGIFYPTGYVLGASGRDTAAREAAALRRTGVSSDDILVASAADVLELHRMLTSDHGLLARFERFIASHYGDDADLAGELVELANRGHAFVVEYAPDDDSTARTADAVRPFNPVLLRKYDPFTTADLR